MTAYDDAMQAGGNLRQAGRFDEAKAQFENAIAAAAPGSLDLALASYFLGLVAQDRDDNAGSLAPLAAALTIYDRQADGARSAGLAGSALGLSLLRLRRFGEAAQALERAVAQLSIRESESPQTLASSKHNLAMAYTRGGDPQRGLAAAKNALAAREQLDGPYHPLTIETKLVSAYAQIECGDLAGAGTAIRAAAKVILAGPGEGHAFFADALLTEARRVAREGDGAAAEALARRALYLLKQSGADRASLTQHETDAAALAPLWRTAPKAQSVSDLALWQVRMDVTLRCYQADTLDFAPAPPREKVWFFFVPARWPAHWALHAARLTFAGISQGLSSREPADPNFLDALAAEARVPGEPELTAAALPQAFQARIWEPSIAYSLVRGGVSLPLSVHGFALALAAFGVPDHLLLPLGVEANALHAARSDPRGTLAKELYF